MNPLTSKALLQNAFYAIAETVQVNEQPVQAYITNAHLGMQSRRHIHTLEPIKQGDYVEFGEGVYMVIEDVINLRGAKYKTTIQHCNYKIQLPGWEEKIPNGKDSLGRPKYIIIKHPGRVIHTIIDLDRVNISGSQIRVNTSTMLMLAPDTEENREKIEVNGEYDIFGSQATVQSINRLRTGLLEIHLEKKYA